MWILEYRGEDKRYTGHIYFCLVGGNNYIAGRKDCELPLSFEGDETLSRRHALLKVSVMPLSLLDEAGAGPELFLMDLSKYGTFINKEELGTVEKYRQLHPADEVIFGKGAARFRVLQRHIFVCFDDGVANTTKEVLRDHLSRLGGHVMKEPVDITEYDPMLCLYITQEIYPSRRVLLALLYGMSFVMPEYLTAFLDSVESTPIEGLKAVPSTSKFLPPRLPSCGSAPYKRPDNGLPTVYSIPTSGTPRTRVFKHMLFIFVKESCNAESNSPSTLESSYITLYRDALIAGGAEVAFLSSDAPVMVLGHIRRRFVVLESAQFAKFLKAPQTLPHIFELASRHSFVACCDQNIIDTLISGCNVSQFLSESCAGLMKISKGDTAAAGSAKKSGPPEDVESNATPDPDPEPRLQTPTPMVHAPTTIYPKSTSHERASSPQPTVTSNRNPFTPPPSIARTILPQGINKGGRVKSMMPGSPRPSASTQGPNHFLATQIAQLRTRSPLSGQRTPWESVSIACQEHDLNALRSGIEKVTEVARRAEKQKFLDDSTLRFCQSLFQRNEKFLLNLQHLFQKAEADGRWSDEGARIEAVVQAWHYSSALNRTIYNVLVSVGASIVFTKGAISLSQFPPSFVQRAQILLSRLPDRAEDVPLMRVSTPTRLMRSPLARRSPTPRKTNSAGRFVERGGRTSTPQQRTPSSHRSPVPQHCSPAPRRRNPSPARADIETVQRKRQTYVLKYGERSGQEHFMAWLAGQPAQWERTFQAALQKDHMTFEDVIIHSTSCRTQEVNASL